MAEQLAGLNKGERIPSLAPYTSEGTTVYQSTSYGDLSSVSYTVPKRTRYRIFLYTNTEHTPSLSVRINGYDFDSIFFGSPIGVAFKAVKADCEKGDVITFFQETRSGHSPASYVGIIEY